MTEIDFAYFNYEHVLSAYLLCLFSGTPHMPPRGIDADPATPTEQR